MLSKNNAMKFENLEKVNLHKQLDHRYKFFGFLYI